MAAEAGARHGAEQFFLALQRADEFNDNPWNDVLLKTLDTTEARDVFKFAEAYADHRTAELRKLLGDCGAVLRSLVMYAPQHKDYVEALLSRIRKAVGNEHT